MAPRTTVAFIAALAVVATGASDATAGKVVLKSGFEAHGIPVNVPGLNQKNAAANLGQNVPQSPYWMVDDGVRRYFIHRQNVQPGPQGVDGSDDSSKYARFKLEPLRRRLDAVPTWIGAFIETTPWDEHGRRRVTLATPQGREDIQLAITRLDPRYLTVASTSHEWDFGLVTSTLPADRLRQIIHTAIDPKNPDQRLAVVSFFLQCENQLGAARAELDSIRRDFPELAARAEEMQGLLLEQSGRYALAEVAARRRIGQHRLARYLAQRMAQEELSGDTLREAQIVLDEYAAADEQLAQARMLLSSLQSELPGDEAAIAAPLRAFIERELTYDSLPRLQPFLQNADAANLPAGEKLAFAYSGWVLGAAHAGSSLKEAVALWDARALVLEYLHPQTDFGDRKLLLERLQESEGVSVEVIARMVPQLPTPLEFASGPAATMQTIELPPTLDSDITVRYAVQAPPEYDPARPYPAIVLLRPEGRTIEDAIATWGGTVEKPGMAQRRGYVVIAPDLAPSTVGQYDYGRDAHDAVLRTLFDARQRLNIDSHCVFLAGHGMGGDAAFDIGLAHPDLFAGVVPITGQFQHAAALLKDNAPQLPFYVVGGERDRNTLDVNASAMAARMQRGWDLIYCEYKQRGFEPYLEELPRIFDWMEFHRRPPEVTSLKQTFVRDFENRVGWVKWLEPPAAASKPILWGQDKPGKRDFTVEAQIPTRQNVFVSRQPGKHTVLWLSPDLVDYESKVKITVNAGTPFRDFLQPDLAALLDDLRERGDRQRLYWTRLQF